MQGNNSSNWPKFNARPVLSEAIGNAILHQRPKKLKKETKKKKRKKRKNLENKWVHVRLQVQLWANRISNHTFMYNIDDKYKWLSEKGQAYIFRLWTI